MGKGITPVVAVVLLLLITFGLVASLFQIFNSTQESASAEVDFSVEDIEQVVCTKSRGDTVLYLQNKGDQAIKTGRLTGQVNSKLDKNMSADKKVVEPLERFTLQIAHRILTRQDTVELYRSRSNEFKCTEDRRYSETHNTAPDCSKVSYIGSGTDSDPYRVTNDYQLQCMKEDMTKSYALERDINASGTRFWNNKKGFIPIGSSGFSGGDCDSNTNFFTGNFYGNDHAIKGVHLNWTGKESNGLFGAINYAEIKDLTLLGGKNYGSGTCGGSLIGYTQGNDVLIEDVYSSMDVNGSSFTGGLIGRSQGGNITKVTVTSSVKSTSIAGGIIGMANGGKIENTYYKGMAEGAAAGGIAGYYLAYGPNPEYTIFRSYVSGKIKGDSNVGGIVGFNNYGIINRSYSSAKVERATGSGGGLVGTNNPGSKIVDTYWDVEHSGQSSATTVNNGDISNVKGLKTSQMTGKSPRTHMERLNFGKTWTTRTLNDNYPYFKWRYDN